MKKILLGLFLLVVLVVLAGAWIFLGAATGFEKEKQVLYISSHAATPGAVMDSLRKRKIVSSPRAFRWLAGQMDYWEHIRPGKYEIREGSSLLSIVRMLRNGRQTPVKLVITKIRTKEDLARLTGNKFEFDSMAMMNYLSNADSLRQWNVDTAKAMTLVLPNTYEYFWNTTPSAVIRKMAEYARAFWTEERKQKATQQGLDRAQAYILASIIEEETNNNEEKPTVASVYLNRLRKGMPLQADPTIKFAMRNFALKRIYEKYLFVESPYNTYRNKGLPPGPICTPSAASIDAVLNAPSTTYLYFVAKPDFTEGHVFSSTYEEHMIKARQYQQALNRRDSMRSKQP